MNDSPNLAVLGNLVKNVFSFLSAKTLDVAGVPHAIVPAGVKLENLSALLERERPERIRRVVSAHDARGLIDYVNTYKGPNTKLYCTDVDDPQVVARMDDHLIDTPSHVTHVCEFHCPFTSEWTTWTKGNKAAMGQLAFAEFIETNARDIRSPAASDLLQIVTNFSDARTADFSSAIRLNDGQVQFSYVQKDQPGKVVIPDKIQLALPVFEGANRAYLVDARLRYRLKESALTLWYELDRPDVVRRTAYDELLTIVSEATALPIIRAL